MYPIWRTDVGNGPRPPRTKCEKAGPQEGGDRTGSSEYWRLSLRLKPRDAKLWRRIRPQIRLTEQAAKPRRMSPKRIVSAAEARRSAALQRAKRGNIIECQHGVTAKSGRCSEDELRLEGSKGSRPQGYFRMTAAGKGGQNLFGEIDVRDRSGGVAWRPSVLHRRFSCHTIPRPISAPSAGPLLVLFGPSPVPPRVVGPPLAKAGLPCPGATRSRCPH